MNPRKSLTDILSGGKGAWLEGDWHNIQAAPDYGKPIPKGRYKARLIGGEPFEAKTGTPGYRLRFEVREGEHQRRQLTYTIWLTEAASSGAVRDFNKLGISSKCQLEQGIPPGILADITVVIRENDEGTQHNEVRTFDVTGVEPGDAFTPATTVEGEPLDTSFAVEQLEAESAPSPTIPRSDPSAVPPTPMPDSPTRGKPRKRQQANLSFGTNGVAGSGPYEEGR